MMRDLELRAALCEAAMRKKQNAERDAETTRRAAQDVLDGSVDTPAEAARNRGAPEHAVRKLVKAAREKQRAMLAGVLM